jgi:hypothetical protein
MFLLNILGVVNVLKHMIGDHQGLWEGIQGWAYKRLTCKRTLTFYQIVSV